MILNDGIVRNTFLPDPADAAVVTCVRSIGCCSITENKEIAKDEEAEDETTSTFNDVASTDGDNNGIDDEFLAAAAAVLVDVDFIVEFLCNIVAPVQAPAAFAVVVFVIPIADNDDNDFLLLFFINSDIIESLLFKFLFFFYLFIQTSTVIFVFISLILNVSKRGVIEGRFGSS